MSVLAALVLAGVSVPNAATAAQAQTKAQSAPSSSAMALFRAQRFAEAAEAARAEKTADGYALAARATLAVAAYFTPDKKQADQVIGRALADTDAALALDPNHEEAGLQRAIASGYRAKLRRSPSLGKEAKRMMEQAIKRAPDNGFAYAALGGWHGEAVDTLGSMMAKGLMGAEKAQAFRYLNTAQVKDPDNPIFPVFEAFLLLRLEGNSSVPQVRALLTKAIGLKAQGGVEALMQTQARAVAAALEAGQTAKAVQLAERYRPFGQIGDS